MTKIRSLAAAILFISTLLLSCKNSGDSKLIPAAKTEMSSSEKENAKKEISSRIDEIVKGAKDLNIEEAIKPYSNDRDFIIINPDGSVSDYQTMKNAQATSLSLMKNLNFTTLKEDFKFLSDSLVICTWIGSTDFELKTGVKMKIEPYVGTMIFSKKAGEWKIIYAHETAGQPVTIEAKK